MQNNQKGYFIAVTGVGTVGSRDGGIGISNQVEQLTHQVNDVTTDQLMTTPYRLNNSSFFFATICRKFNLEVALPSFCNGITLIVSIVNGAEM